MQDPDLGNYEFPAGTADVSSKAPHPAKSGLKAQSIKTQRNSETPAPVQRNRYLGNNHSKRRLEALWKERSTVAAWGYGKRAGSTESRPTAGSHLIPIMPRFHPLDAEYDSPLIIHDAESRSTDSRKFIPQASASNQCIGLSRFRKRSEDSGWKRNGKLV
ncbi:hypothetical protein K440DRAFT_636674 [Wilcoxina mikolae CBS 423.85]|nr:hypothetical protein K440DRAFT_636674 [Wilcoxina mikolae CBS 423.85]